MCKCKTCGKTELDTELYSSIKAYCKEHWRQRVRENRAANIEYYREFDRLRANLPHRVEAREKYQKTVAFEKSHRKASIKYIDNNPDRRKAHVAVGHAVGKGKLTPLPCFCCGAKAEAHHPDYSRPLDVVWLCSAHHKQAHKITY